MNWSEIVKELTGKENNVVIISRSQAGRVRVASTYPRAQHGKILDLMMTAYTLERSTCDSGCVHQGIVKDGKRRSGVTTQRSQTSGGPK